MLFVYIYITRLASDEIFSPSNKIHREVGRAQDLSTPLVIYVAFCVAFLLLLVILIFFLFLFHSSTLSLRMKFRLQAVTRNKHH
jgi:uncharacterized membrane protein